MNWQEQWLLNRRWVQIIVLSSLFALAVRLLISFDLDSTALLYLAIPYLIALALAFFRRREPTTSIVRKYLNMSLDSLIIMLASSLILFEGFICVLMFMPIYFGSVLVAFGVHSLIIHISERRKESSLKIHLLPYLLLVLSLEGVTPNLSHKRENALTVTKIVNTSPEQIRQYLEEPIDLEVDRHWFLSIFPMPYHIDAESLNPGDIHTIDYRYKRWFFTNVHEGSIKLLIEKVTERNIRTRILEDTSYLSNYMTLQGTEIELSPLSNNTTEVSLTVFYSRELDPSWYFGPLQEFGVQKMAELLIDELIDKDDERG